VIEPPIRGIVGAIVVVVETGIGILSLPSIQSSQINKQTAINTVTLGS
jgi:hypothetical protein